MAEDIASIVIPLIQTYDRILFHRGKTESVLTNKNKTQLVVPVFLYIEDHDINRTITWKDIDPLNKTFSSISDHMERADAGGKTEQFKLNMGSLVGGNIQYHQSDGYVGANSEIWSEIEFDEDKRLFQVNPSSDLVRTVYFRLIPNSELYGQLMRGRALDFLNGKKWDHVIGQREFEI